jgi:hypothetical protein
MAEVVSLEQQRFSGGLGHGVRESALGQPAPF